MPARDNLKGLNTKDATANAEDILEGKIAYNAEGEVVGTMPNNTPASIVLDTNNTSYTVPQGYHNGNGSVSIDVQSKEAIPSGQEQNIIPDAGRVLSSVTIQPVTTNSGIGKELYDEGKEAGIESAKVGNALPADVLEGKTFTNNGGLQTGTMPNNGSFNVTLDVNNTSQAIPAGYHDGTGNINIDIQSKNVEPTGEEQTIIPDEGKVLVSVTTNAVTQSGGIGKTLYDTGNSEGATVGEAEGRAAAMVGTVTADKVLNGYTFTNSSVVEATGTLATQAKTATPSGSAQTISPDNGKLLSSVTVSAVTQSEGIGKTLYDNGNGAGDSAGYTSGYNKGLSDTKVGTATADKVLSGKTFTNSSGIEISGTMTNNGAWGKTKTNDTTYLIYNVTSDEIIVIPGGYHNGNGQIIVPSYSSSCISNSLCTCTNTLCLPRCGVDSDCFKTCTGGLVIQPPPMPIDSRC